MNIVEEEHKKKNQNGLPPLMEALDTYFKLKQVHDMENQLEKCLCYMEHLMPGVSL